MSRMQSAWAVMILSFTTGLALGLPWAWAADNKEEDEKVHDLMERVHEGRKSPFGRTKTQLKSDMPDWMELDKHMPAFMRMIQALKESRVADVRDSADGYVAAVKSMAVAVGQRNRQTARTALDALTTSCADCHYKGGPGGKLDD